VGRALLQFASMFAIFTAYGMMPLADAVAITFSSPLFLTVLSIPLLGEEVGPYRWGAVIVGFIAILVMVHPGAGTLQVGAFLALFNALSSASVTIAMRRMSLTESSTTLVFYQTMTTAILSLCVVPFGFIAPSWTDAAMLALVGLSSGVGQFCWTQAFRFAPAAVAAPFSYMSMVWALLFGWLFWDEIPSVVLMGGSAVVAASGLYILYRETVRRVPIVRQHAH
jgi:drug/metabolite transporter (DMT)-like permease